MEAMKQVFALLKGFAFELQYEGVSEAAGFQLLCGFHSGNCINTDLNVLLRSVVMKMSRWEESTVVFSDRRTPAANTATCAA